MFIIWGWGKVTRHNKGAAFVKACTHCNQTSTWNLYVMMTWFTIFFIPVIPYKKQYAYMCPYCKSYIPLTKQQYLEALEAIENQNIGGLNSDSSNSQSQDTNNDTNINYSNYTYDNNANNNNHSNDDAKYQGKTETQINYLKQMEEYENSLNSK